MARKRMLSPAFFTHEELTDLDPYARILFASLWCQADKEGRLEDRPKRIKHAALPFDDVDIEQLLDSLARNSEQFIVRYSVDGKRYIQIPAFAKWQNPHPKESKSELPGPEKAEQIQAPAEIPGNSGNFRESPGKNGASKPFPSESLTESSPSESLTESESSPSGESRPGESEPISLAFDEFWKAYPRRDGKRQGKKPALERWRKLPPDKRAAAFRGLDAYAARCEGYAKDAVRYLAQELWLDDEDPDEPAMLPAVVTATGPPWLGVMLGAYAANVGSPEAIRGKLIEHCRPLTEVHGERSVQEAWALYCREESTRNPRDIRPHTFAANFILIATGAFWNRKESSYETPEEANRVVRIEASRLRAEREEMRAAGLDPLNVRHIEEWRANGTQVAEVVS